MKVLNKRQINTGKKGLESKEEEQGRLFSDNTGNRSSSLEFNPNSLVSEKMQLDKLARILVDIFLERKRNGNI